MTRKEAMDYLKVDRKKLTAIMLERGLRFHPKTGQASRAQVEQIARDIEAEIIGVMEQPKPGGRPMPNLTI